MTSAPKLPRLPRDPDDDYAARAVDARLELLRTTTGARLAHVAGERVPLAEARGKIEGLIGFAQVPLGVAGPLRVDTSVGAREVYVPFATTEGAMVAAYARGMRLLNAGGVRARVVRERLTQNPILVYRDARAACAAGETARAAFAELRELVAGTTRHGALVALESDVIGRRLLLSLVFTTGDAIGINMAARATELCCAELARRTVPEAWYVHGQDVEKRANARALVEGRGRSVVVDARVPRETLADLARVTPEQLAAISKTYAVGFAALGTQNHAVQVANGLAAIYLACGQDAAYVTESATGQLDLEVDAAGDLYAALTLPSLLVGTVGGGSGQGTARECLELLGCAGAGHANTFAELVGAALLAGDLSLMAAFCSHEFVQAHETLGRNRPEVRA
ncbi:MAG: 3-hydroxy-3-methylglutaryl-CoA reductase [Planctomycetes bacterium]|nr:3-hydroxy-3-methylglutaryl-CoA reductase [Planctomycetota bacterium]